MSEKIVQLNEEVIKGQIKELVRGSVEETLNELLEKEAMAAVQEHPVKAGSRRKLTEGPEIPADLTHHFSVESMHENTVRTRELIWPPN